MADIKPVYGIYRGEVVATDDPEQRGRLMLRVPQVLGTGFSAWAEATDPPSHLPDVGDWVWVQFTGGDVTKPVYVSYGGGKLIDQLDILNRPPFLQANTPAPGSFSWGEFKVRREGVDITIPAGSSSAVYVYWTYADGAFTKVESTDLPLDLTTDDYMAFVNKNGVALDVHNTQVIDGSLLVPESVTANAIAANTITALLLQGEVIRNGLVADGETRLELSDGGLSIITRTGGVDTPVVQLLNDVSGLDPAEYSEGSIRTEYLVVKKLQTKGNYTANGGIVLWDRDDTLGETNLDGIHLYSGHFDEDWPCSIERYAQQLRLKSGVYFDMSDNSTLTRSEIRLHGQDRVGTGPAHEARIEVFGHVTTDGNVTVGDDLAVTGNTTLTGDLAVGDDLTVTGDIAVTGTVSTPNKPRFKGYLGTNFVLPDGAINYPALSQGLLSGAIALTSGQVEILETGYYTISGQVRFNGTAGATPLVAVIRVTSGGVGTAVAASYGVQSVSNVTVGITAMPIYLTAGDLLALGGQAASTFTMIGSSIATYLSVVAD